MLILVLILAAVDGASLRSAGEGRCSAPYPLTDRDPTLQASLASELVARGLDTHVQSQRLAIAVVDLTHPGHMYYAGINDDHMLYAASLPKIGILLAVAHLANQGRVPWEQAFPFRLRKMITISDNAFASWGFDVAGGQAIAEVLQQTGYCLYEPPDGGLWIGRPFRKGGSTRRDPLFNLSHGATARQTARFYVLLAAGRLVSPYWSARMLDLMAPPEYVHKFVAALAKRPGVRFLARKSGTWKTFHSDSALIQHHGKRYVLVGLTDLDVGEQTLRSLAGLVDDLIMAGAHRRL